MDWNRLSLLVLFFYVFTTSGGTSPLAQEQSAAPHIVLDHPLHVVAPDSTAKVIPSGTYLVAAQSGPALQLTGPADTMPFLLEATSITHQESLAAVTAALIPTDEDTVHLVLLYPDGTALDAIGSFTGLRSRAPTLTGSPSTTPLTQVQIQQGLQAFGETARIAGTPPAPVLTTPLAGHTIAAWGQQFTWQPAVGEPLPTAFRLCLSEAGTRCPQPGQATTGPVAVMDLPPAVRTYRVTAPMLRPLLTYGQEKPVTWTVGACVPSTPIGGGTLAGPGTIQTCTYARPRPLTWRLVLEAPRLNSPEPLINDKPWLSIQSPVEGAHHYLYCLTRSDVSDGESCRTILGVIFNSGSSLGVSGWDWKFQALLPVFAQLAGNSAVGLVSATGIPPHIFQNRILNWYVGACPEEPLPCTWSSPLDLATLPVISHDNIRLVREAPSRFRFDWPSTTSSSVGVTHERLCIATRGTRLTVVAERLRERFELFWIPGMLHDLCSDGYNISPGQQPAYRRPLPPEVTSICPGNQCEIPRPVRTFRIAPGSGFTLDLRAHPELAPFAGQPMIVALAACSQSDRNCLWTEGGARTFDLPANSREPSPVTIRHSSSSLSLTWYPWAGNDYYIPCIREPNATCDTGNLLAHPRMDVPRIASLQNHPQACSFSGPQISGTRVIQVAGCNEAWGCRWSSPQQFSFQNIRLPSSGSALQCRS
jgi:hypothetical protein